MLLLVLLLVALFVFDRLLLFVLVPPDCGAFELVAAAAVAVVVCVVVAADVVVDVGVADVGFAFVATTCGVNGGF